MSDQIIQIITAVISSLITSGVFVGIGKVFLETTLEKKITEIFKRRELLFSEVTNQRAEIATDVFRLCRKAASKKLGIKEFVEDSNELSNKVPLWFSDEAFEAFRDYILRFVKEIKEPSGESGDWTENVEPVLQKIVSDLRPDSDIINREGFDLKDDGKEYHFIPYIFFE